MSIVNKISAFNRKRKYAYFLETFQPEPFVTLLDIGFTGNDYSAEANYLEKHYPYPGQITALGVDARGKDHFQSSFPEVKVVIYDGSVFLFAADTFDIGWSNAVIEHVGNRAKQVLFVKEMRRTCKRVYFTTPNRWFPFDLHTKLPFVHWLPKPVFNKILIALGLRWAAGDYMNLLSVKDIRSICKEAGIDHIKIKRNRLLGFTMDFSVTID